MQMHARIYTRFREKGDLLKKSSEANRKAAAPNAPPLYPPLATDIQKLYEGLEYLARRYSKSVRAFA